MGGPDEEPVVIPIEDALDLHPFAPRDIPDVVASYLEAARAAGFREVRLIHGRGQGEGVEAGQCAGLDLERPHRLPEAVADVTGEEARQKGEHQGDGGEVGCHDAAELLYAGAQRRPERQPGTERAGRTVEDRQRCQDADDRQIEPLAYHAKPAYAWVPLSALELP